MMTDAERVAKWNQSYRSIEVKNTSCWLCGDEDVACLTFTDNEGYGSEHVCFGCFRFAETLTGNESCPTGDTK